MALVTAIMIGDVVGESGLAALEGLLPALIREYAAGLVVVNGENAAEGFGMNEAVLKRILAAGADVVSSGNHIWEKREFWPVMDSEERLIRPANYPAGVPGRGWTMLTKDGISWFVINLQGREFMASTDCPFKCFDAILQDHILSNTDSGAQEGSGGDDTARPLILVDFHAESTREKESLACYLDGRVSAIAGTHTHVQTADERLLPGGSGYITDLGMTGAVHSIIGMDMDTCLRRAKTQVPHRMVCAGGEAAVQGIAVSIDRGTGKTVSIERIKRKV